MNDGDTIHDPIIVNVVINKIITYRKYAIHRSRL